MPDLPAALLERTSLLDRLDGASERAVTLVTAPAGYGSTTLLAHWCHQRCRLPVTWLGAGERRAAGSTLAALADALEEASGRRLGRIRAALDPATADPDPRAGLELAGVPPALLVVDGWARDESAEVLQRLATVVGEAPTGGLRLMVSGRAAPPRGFSRLRLGGRADHLDESDLSLRPADVRDLVARLAGAAIDDELARALCDEVEGWMAGAVMLALAWAPGQVGATDLAGLGRGYEAIDDYLTTEVLDRLDADVRQALVTTSCVEELSGSLLDHVTGRGDGDGLLSALRAGGDFLIPLTPGRHRPDPSFRLHRRLRALLVRMAGAAPGRRDRALRRAAEWCEAEGQHLRAAALWRATGDMDALSNHMTAHTYEILTSDGSGELGDFLTGLPRSFLREHMEYVVAAAYLQFVAGEVHSGLDMLRLMEPHLESANLLLALALKSGAFAFFADTRPFLADAEAALALCDELGDDLEFPALVQPAHTSHLRMQAAGAATIASALAGDWDRAREHDAAIDGATVRRMPVLVQLRVFGLRTWYLALSGRLAEAATEAEEALRIIPAGDEFSDFTTDPVHWALAAVHHGRGDRVAAEASLDGCEARARRAGRSNVLTAAAALRAHLAVDVRHPDVALSLLAEHRHQADHRGAPPLAALAVAAEARALTALGRPDEALATARSGPLTSWTASAVVFAALAVQDVPLARRMADTWPVEATPGSRVRREVARAAVLAAQGLDDDAARHLEAALRAAAPDGAVHPFTEAGASLAGALRRAGGSTQDRPAAALATTVLGHLGLGPEVQPLSPREALVLEQLATGATLATTAGNLVLSPNTVKSHVKAIYRKLGVTSRAEAVAVWRSGTATRGG